MKNKKGFSLVELLIVISIIGVLAGIIIPNVSRYLKNSKAKYNENLNTELVSFAKSYYSENKDKLPRGYINEQGLPVNKTLVGASYLLNNNYITGEFVDSEGNDCTNTSYVIVEKEGSDYKYTSCIVCNNGYTNIENKNKCIYSPDAGGEKHEYILPTCSITSSSDKIGKWTNEDIILNLNLQDNTSLLGYYLNGSNDLNKVTGKEVNENITLNTSINTNNYYVIVEDQYANQGKCTFDGEIKIDKVVPTVNITATKKSAGTAVSNSSWSNEGLNFKFTKETTGLSGYTIYYCKDTNNTCEPTTKAENDTLITAYNTTTGTYYIRYKIVSGAGTSSSINSFTAKVDTTKPSAPTVALVKGDWTERYNNTWYNYSIYVSGKANSSDPTPSSTDNLSGIAKYQISTDNSTWYDWSYNSSSSVYRINWEGTTNRYIRAVDNAGNISDVTTKTIKIDWTKPSCSLSASTSGVYFYSKSDSLSGISGYGLSTSSSATYNGTTSLGLSSNTFYGYVKDNAGNTNYCTRYVFGTSSTSSCPSGYYECSSGYSCECYKSYARSSYYYYKKSSRTCYGSYSYASYVCSSYTNKVSCANAGCIWDGSVDVYGKVQGCGGTVCPSGYYKCSSGYSCQCYKYTPYWGSESVTYPSSCSSYQFDCTYSYYGYTYVSCYGPYSGYYDCNDGYTPSGAYCYAYANKTTNYYCSSGTKLNDSYCYS